MRVGAGALILAALLVACSDGDDAGSGDPATSTGDAVGDVAVTDAPRPSTGSASPAEAGDVDRQPASAAAVAADPAGLPSISEPDPATTIGRLPNGVTYYVRSNDNPGGRVDMRLAVDAGSGLEDRDEAGVAHFLEHMLFNGTEQFPGNELVAALRSFGTAFGADVNARTTFDETVYELTMAADDDVVETGLDVLAQWLSAATIDPDEVIDERGIVLDEWRGSAASSNGRIFEGVERLYLAGSPYEGRRPIGTAEAIEAMTAEPLRRFYDDWYRPDNAAVIVVGDIDVDAIMEGIEEHFGSVSSRGDTPSREVLRVDPSEVPRAEVLADPDVVEGLASVGLPRAVPPDAAPEASLQRDLLDQLAFDIIATRLSNDARRGIAPFEDARIERSSYVRYLDVPEIVVTADGEDLEASTRAIFDELERVRRYGFGDAETARAVAELRSAAASGYAGRDSRQDASFADEYVRNFLEQEPIPTADATFELITAVLDAATPETIAHRVVDRLADAAPHVFVLVPTAQADDVPSADTFRRQAAERSEHDVEPRDDDVEVVDALMEEPEPVLESTSEPMLPSGANDLVDPLLLTFPNGVRVALNVTPIVDGNVAFEARSPGGAAVVADAEVADADAAGPVVGSSGVGPYGPVELDAFLAGVDVDVQARIEPFTEGFDGFVATSDLEVLFQLVHLLMTAPRVDDVALERYVDDELAFATDPSVDPGYAELDALLDARYDDPRYLLPSVEGLRSVDADGVERVFRDRYGDASDWSFAFSGDFDLDEGVDLARRYLGTLPGSGRVETGEFDEPPPPPGVVSERVRAGDGEQARVTFLFTEPAGPERRDDVAALLLAEIVSNRLTVEIRERLGESYAPFAEVRVGDGASPAAETYVSVSTGREMAEAVSTTVLDELGDLRTSGPSDGELDAASEVVRRQLQLFNNPQINDEVLDVLVDPAGNQNLAAFVVQELLVPTFDADELRAYLDRWTSAEHYIEVQTLPR